MLSLIFDAGGLVAGFIVSAYLGVISSIPWAFLMYPGILTIRGVVNGVFSGQLSTGLHVGTVMPRFFRNTRYFRAVFSSVVTLTFISGVLVGISTYLAGLFLVPSARAEILDTVISGISAMGLSLVAVSPLTMAVSIVSYRFNLDPDFTVYPIMSTAADILATLCYILVLTMYPVAGHVLTISSAVFFLSTAYLVVTNLEDRLYRETMRDITVTLAMVTAISFSTGIFFKRISERMGGRREIYTIYPALIDTVGDVGSIVGSITTTRLALGTVRPEMGAIYENAPEVLGSWFSSLLMFAAYAAASSFLAEGAGNVWDIVKVLLLSNLAVMPIIVALVHTIAISALRRGWNPDNFVNPLISTLSDSITTLALFVVLEALSF